MATIILILTKIYLLLTVKSKKVQRFELFGWDSEKTWNWHKTWYYNSIVRLLFIWNVIANMPCLWW